MIQACFEGLTAEAWGKVHVIAESSQIAPGVWQPRHPLWPPFLYSYMQPQSLRGPLGWIFNIFWYGHQTARETKRLWQTWAVRG